MPESVQARLLKIDGHLTTLNSTRQEVLDRKQMMVVEAVLRYGVILTDLGAYGETLGELAGEGRVADSLRAVAAFARAKAGAAEQQAVSFAALSSGHLDEEQYSSFVATQTSQQEALTSFGLAASTSQRQLVDHTYTGDAVTLAERMSGDMTRLVDQPVPPGFLDSATNSLGAHHRPDALGGDPARVRAARPGRPGPIRRDPAGRDRVTAGADHADRRDRAGRGAGPLPERLAAPAA